jgi:hypothetical protein
MDRKQTVTHPAKINRFDTVINTTELYELLNGATQP